MFICGSGRMFDRIEILLLSFFILPTKQKKKLKTTVNNSLIQAGLLFIFEWSTIARVFITESPGHMEKAILGHIATLNGKKMPEGKLVSSPSRK
jgi:hypothetical protein